MGPSSLLFLLTRLPPPTSPCPILVRCQRFVIVMDPAATSAPTATSTNDSSNKRRNQRRGGHQHQHQQQRSSEGATPKDSQPKKGSNNNQRKKDGTGAGGESSSRPGPNPRAPRTIAATDPVDLQGGKHTTAGAATTTAAAAAAGTTPAAGEDAEEHSCFICTENIVIFAVSDCNHRTCHLCSLRLRALYKTRDCTYCKVSNNKKASKRKFDTVVCGKSLADHLTHLPPAFTFLNLFHPLQAEQSVMLFTRDPEKPFQDYDLKSMAYYDRKLNIYFEDQEMYEDTMVILRFNCPDPSCDVACPEGWKQLKTHVKNVHKLMLW